MKPSTRLCTGYKDKAAAAKNITKNSPHTLSVYACCATKRIKEQGAFLIMFPTLSSTIPCLSWLCFTAKTFKLIFNKSKDNRLPG